MARPEWEVFAGVTPKFFDTQKDAFKFAKTYSISTRTKVYVAHNGNDVAVFDFGKKKTLKLAKEGKKLSTFVRSYLETAIWASTDEDGNPLDDEFSVSDFSPAAIKTAVNDCESFEDNNAEYLAEAGTAAENGHDFWLTRNRHGAGFWDRGYDKDVAERLTLDAHVYGSQDVYLGDDGQLHLS